MDIVTYGLHLIKHVMYGEVPIRFAYLRVAALAIADLGDSWRHTQRGEFVCSRSGDYATFYQHQHQWLSWEARRYMGERLGLHTWSSCK